MTTLSEQVGSLLTIGYEGDDAPVCDALAKGRAGGVVLFTRNIHSKDQIKALTRRLRDAAGRNIPIGIDQEGGRVARLANAGLAAGPSARTIASGPPEDAYQWGLHTGGYLVELGINLNFAPVLDVDTNPKNPVIGDRSYGTTPEQVVRYAREAIRGLQQAGVVACGKHFPGHGDTHLDSHHDLPVVHHNLERLRQIELKPFADLLPNLKTIMTAHVVYPALDPNHPATLSKKIITGLLRQQMGYQGVIISDDLEMAAVAKTLTPSKRAVKAIRAGADMLLICRSQSVWESAFEGLLREAENDNILALSVAESAARIHRLFGGNIDEGLLA
jgi:beta-N-acetylhexosaminidase